MKAIQLLPAYVNRRTAERELIKDLIMSMDNLDNTLDTLEKTFDPPVDAFISMQQLGKLHWEPGQEIDDFFYVAKRKAFHARTGMKFLASIPAAQLPRDIQARDKRQSQRYWRRPRGRPRKGAHPSSKTRAHRTRASTEQGK